MRKDTRDTINRALNNANSLTDAWDGAAALLEDLEKTGAMPEWVAGHLRDFDERLNNLEGLLQEMRLKVQTLDSDLFPLQVHQPVSSIEPPPFINPYRPDPEPMTEEEPWWEEPEIPEAKD